MVLTTVGLSQLLQVMMDIPLFKCGKKYKLEVQSQSQSEFSERMYIYHSRIFDRYRRSVVSLAILGDEQKSWTPNRYERQLWRCRAILEFPVVKLIDYSMEDLSASRSPLAPIVQAHLSAQIAGKDVRVGYEKKLSLIKSLYSRGYGREDIVQLFRLIDWFIGLPQSEEERLWAEIQTLEQETKMPYITSVERIGISKGLEQGQITKGQEDIIRILEVRFQNIPPKLRELINKIKDLNVLWNILIQAVTLQSVEAFQSVARQYFTEDELASPATEQNPPQKADESE
ncbi:transposase [Limnofasciculus baicalensis]|uniref:Transposase n=1 Tax=Limnofasciculus baicalensis BBK-W-15 TaxID=2699891 RepID=A0AAE3GRH8_9CYAN|nr:transposase [Limnofasciculus baicalensis]MCP2728622.1 transposase [Limnofasciculus baicalensis BBK-W-15]